LVSKVKRSPSLKGQMNLLIFHCRKLRTVFAEGAMTKDNDLDLKLWESLISTRNGFDLSRTSNLKH
jgi:hypothetical protein